MDYVNKISKRSLEIGEAFNQAELELRRLRAYAGLYGSEEVRQTERADKAEAKLVAAEKWRAVAELAVNIECRICGYLVAQTLEEIAEPDCETCRPFVEAYALLVDEEREPIVATAAERKASE